MQACTSEVFGQATEFPQNELTPMHPVSPYAISKVASFWHTVNVREAYGMFAVNGILFNHESERRGITHVILMMHRFSYNLAGIDFVSRKITTAVAMIMCGTAEFVELGNLDAKRDWGSAQDYVRGIHAMLQHSVADDFVLATGENWTVRQFAEEAFLAGGICLR
jgi:GDPmannose 4,6-dehydratase